ncbi:hypothetical protein [Thalassotalea fusca]
MIQSVIDTIKEYLSKTIVALVLFALIFSAFQVMKSQHDAELLKALQTIERIKLKWTLTEE